MSMIKTRFVFASLPINSTARTEARITAGANKRGRARARVYFDGTSSSGAKVLCETIIGSSGGTATASPPSPVKRFTSDPESITATAEWKFSPEPTTPGTVIDAAVEHPQNKWVSDYEDVPGGGTISYRFTCSSAVNARIVIDWEE